MITSNSNETIKKLAKRISLGEVVVLDTKNLIQEALNSSFEVDCILHIQNADIEFLTNCACPTIVVASHVLTALTNVKSSTGVAVAIKLKNSLPEQPLGDFVVLDNIQDPGNVGTILRTAQGANFNTVVLINCASVLSPKVIRASSGAVFNCNIATFATVADFLKWKTCQTPLVAANLNGKNLYNAVFPPSIGLVLGNEGHGISPELQQACTTTITLPMKNGLESLNVGVAGSIIMYHKQFGGK